MSRRPRRNHTPAFKAKVALRLRAAGIQAFWSGKLEDAERRRRPFRSYCNDRFAEHVGAFA